MSVLMMAETIYVTVTVTDIPSAHKDIIIAYVQWWSIRLITERLRV